MVEEATMKLQVTLDTMGVTQGIDLLRDVACYLDIIEVGMPLLLEAGMAAIAEVKEAFPDVEVLADTKIWHDGTRIAASAFDSGADMVSILGGTTDAEVDAVVRYAGERGKVVAADLSGVRSLVRRSCELEDLGVRYMIVPSGLRRTDPKDDDAFHRNTRAMGGMPLALVRNVMRGLSNSAEVAVVDNITLDNLDDVLATHPGVLLVGRAILKAADPAGAAAEFKRRMAVA